jgi:integrase
MGDRGMGRVFLPTYTDKTTGKLKTSAVWWIEFSHRGKSHRESSKSRKESDARKHLKKRLGESGTGNLVASDVAKTTFADLKKLITDDYATNGRRSANQLAIVLKRLSNGFEGMKAADITASRIKAHQAEQKKTGLSSGTINREMAALKRMFRLGHRVGVVASVPHIAMLQEDNVREGFFEPDDFETFLEHLSDDFKPLFRVAYITGWRVRSELLTREWKHVDFVNGKLRLDPGEDKNKSGRAFPFIPELQKILKRQQARARVIGTARGVAVSHVFFRENGAPILSYRHAWADAVEASKIDRIPHDFRRTAVRNLEMAGVPRSTAMKMVGHKTQSIYNRYAIVDEGMLQDGARKLAALHAQHAKGPRDGKLDRARS